MVVVSRRSALKAAGAGALVMALPRPIAALADDSVETYGLSSFGDLALPPDFPHFSYVNPDAPTGGLLSLQITGTSGNQNFDTFDTLNIYSWKGNGAAGMGATFDTLMTANGDEPDSVYGLLARSVRVSGDKLDYRFRLRPEAKFFDGSPVTAADVAFSLNILKDKGHPVYAQLLREMESAAPEGDDVVHVRFVKDRSRDAHLIVVGMPVFSSAWWKGRDFTAATLDAPLGSGAYKVKTFEQGRFIEYERRPDYWGRTLPVNLGQNNFDRLRFEYYRERQVAFEAFKAGAINYHEEYTSRFWATSYDFPAAKDGRVKKETLHDGAPIPHAGLVSQHPPRAVQGPARARGDRARLRLHVDQQEHHVLGVQAGRLVLPEHPDGGEGPAGTGRTEAARSVPRQAAGVRVRRALHAARKRRLGLRPEAAEAGLRSADRRRLPARRRRDEVAERQAADHRVPRFLERAPAAHHAVHPEPREARRPGQHPHRRRDAVQGPHRRLRLRRGHGGERRVVDARRGAQGRLHLGGRGAAGLAQPRRRLRSGRRRARRNDRQRKVARGAEHRPAARSTACCGPGHYWVPMWYRDTAWVAYWDAFSRPERQPKLGVGAPGTWWWDAEKAKAIGL